MKSLRIQYSDIISERGFIEYLHDGVDIGSGAFELNETAKLKILLPRSAGAVKVFLKLYSDVLVLLEEYECEHQDFDFDTDIYTFTIKNMPRGLYFFSFVIHTPAGVLFGMKGKGRELVFKKTEDGTHFQFSLTEFKFTSDLKYRSGIIYHIFVDRFNKGGIVPKREDAVMMSGWEGVIPEYPEYPGAHLENNTFFGGTLYGIIEKLDYIKSLGTTLIYLSPIFEAYSNHKYDTGDYMTVDAMFGGKEALLLLISEAEKRGIGIILDGVFNHTGADSLYFNKNGRYDSIGAYQSKKSPFYHWYDFQSHPEKYTSWWGIEILPRINPEIDECSEFIAGEGGVIDTYAKMGVAGFRLDVADELSDKFIAKIKARLSKSSPGSILYGEVWEDASNKIAYDKRKSYYLGDELDGVMNYPIRTGIISFLRDKSIGALEYALIEVMFNAPKRIRDTQMNLLGTHDTERIITILAGEGTEGKSNAEISKMQLTRAEKARGERLLKMAYTILATLPGIPSVFYGDEVGLEGYKDPFNRKPYPWKTGNVSIRNFYQKIGKIRINNDLYNGGAFELLLIKNDLLVFSRMKENKTHITVINNSSKDITVKFKRVASGLLSGFDGMLITVKKETSEIIETTTGNKPEIL